MGLFSKRSRSEDVSVDGKTLGILRDQLEAAKDEEGPHPNLPDAEKFGRNVARREKVEFVLTGRDGSLCEKDGSGNDPRSTPG